MALSYDEVLARNIRAERGRNRLGQATVVARMRALGYEGWHRQTLGKIERGERRLAADEVFGLALAMEVTMAALLLPDYEDEPVALPSGDEIHVTGVIRLIFSAGYSRGLRPVTWKDDKPATAPEFVVAPVFMVRGAPYPSRADIAKRIGEADE